jgi:predicted nicotinamide N-methyase
LTAADSHARFIRAHTTLHAPPLVPQIKLHLAGEVMKLWHETEALAALQAFGAKELPPPYWAFAWPGGQALARYILDHPAQFRGKSTLDFGAGSGLVAIAAARAGAAPVLAAEIDPIARIAIELNATANGVFVEAIETDIIGTGRRWDIILAGDMCYERPLAERLIAWLQTLVAEGAIVLLGDPGRHYFPAQGMAKLATYMIPTSRDLEDRDARETSVYKLPPA